MWHESQKIKVKTGICTSFFLRVHSFRIQNVYQLLSMNYLGTRLSNGKGHEKWSRLLFSKPGLQKKCKFSKNSQLLFGEIVDLQCALHYTASILHSGLGNEWFRKLVFLLENSANVLWLVDLPYQLPSAVHTIVAWHCKCAFKLYPLNNFYLHFYAHSMKSLVKCNTP